jgi:uncharacterized RDD family membrane protein YckC
MPATPGFLRRLAAIVYDTMLLAALLLVAAALVTLPLEMGLGYDLDPTNPLYRIYLVLVSVAFFAWFWTHGGQTLGMRVWRLRVVRRDGQPLKLKDALLRYVAALLSWGVCGLGFIWILIDREHLAWHDRISKTKLVLVYGTSDQVHSADLIRGS